MTTSDKNLYTAFTIIRVLQLLYSTTGLNQIFGMASPMCRAALQKEWTAPPPFACSVPLRLRSTSRSFVRTVLARQRDFFFISRPHTRARGDVLHTVTERACTANGDISVVLIRRPNGNTAQRLLKGCSRAGTRGDGVPPLF